MKKWSLWAFAMGIVALSACNDVDDLYDPAKAMERKLAMYESAFVKEFGKIAPNQDWGFGSVETRNNGNGNNNVFAKPDEITTDEIKKVEDWFKENPNPTDYITTIPWSDFYIQNVCYKENGQRLKPIRWKSGNDEGEKWKNKGFDSGKEDYCVVTGMEGNVSFACGGTGNSGADKVTTDKHVIVEIDGSYYIRFKVDDEEWVLKLSPAQYPGAKRVIAEDLGTTGDFDFNDVVFDVSSGEGRSIITVRAAGGMLPLYVDGKEVHELFSVEVTEMVNTVPGEKRLMPVVFSINKELTAKDVKVTVNGIDVVDAEESHELTAEPGSAPQKLCVDTDFEWMEETRCISDKYPEFGKYVGNPSLNKWWKN